MENMRLVCFTEGFLNGEHVVSIFFDLEKALYPFLFKTFYPQEIFE